jgi:hypothetical protein
MKRNPHPAHRSRIAALGVSATAFVSIVTSFAWNTQQAELSTNTGDTGIVPVEQATPAAPSGTFSPVTPAATIAPTAPSSPKTSPATSTPAAPTTQTTAPSVAPATPVAPAAPTTPEVAPAAPAPTVVYTCMSPGGKTENPTASGTCSNAKYGYVLTQI